MSSVLVKCLLTCSKWPKYGALICIEMHVLIYCSETYSWKESIYLVKDILELLKVIWLETDYIFIITFKFSLFPESQYYCVHYNKWIEQGKRNPLSIPPFLPFSFLPFFPLPPTSTPQDPWEHEVWARPNFCYHLRSYALIPALLPLLKCFGLQE